MIGGPGGYIANVGSSGNAGMVPGNYYTKTDLDNGALDSRYYTKTVSDGRYVQNQTLSIQTLSGFWTTTGIIGAGTPDGTSTFQVFGTSKLTGDTSILGASSTFKLNGRLQWSSIASTGSYLNAAEYAVLQNLASNTSISWVLVPNRGTGGSSDITLYSTSAQNSALGIHSNASRDVLFSFGSALRPLDIQFASSAGGGVLGSVAPAVRFFANGNLAVNSITDLNFRFAVVGTGTTGSVLFKGGNTTGVNVRYTDSNDVTLFTANNTGRFVWGSAADDGINQGQFSGSVTYSSFSTKTTSNLAGYMPYGYLAMGPNPQHRIGNLTTLAGAWGNGNGNLAMIGDLRLSPTGVTVLIGAAYQNANGDYGNNVVFTQFGGYGTDYYGDVTAAADKAFIGINFVQKYAISRAGSSLIGFDYNPVFSGSVVGVHTAMRLQTGNVLLNYTSGKTAIGVGAITSDQLAVYGSFYTSSTLRTAIPSAAGANSVAATWKLGSLIAGGLRTVSTSILEAEVNGTIIKILTAV